MNSLLLVGAGGGAGAITRYAVGTFCSHYFSNARFPLATFLVNISGCFLVGVVAAYLERMELHNAELRLLLITGFLGGFTTFSAFGLETTTLVRAGDYWLAVGNIVGSVCLGLIAVLVGLRMGQ